jgi:hypothetical protein
MVPETIMTFVAASALVSACALTAAGRAQASLTKAQLEKRKQIGELLQGIWDPTMAEPLPQKLLDTLREMK